MKIKKTHTQYNIDSADFVAADNFYAANACIKSKGH